MEDPNKTNNGTPADTGTPPVEDTGAKRGKKKKDESEETVAQEAVLPVNACFPCQGTGLIGDPSLPNNKVCLDCLGRGVRG